MIMNGREKCRFLKEIRKEIAERNGIKYLSAECHSSAACPGHCPKCDAESRYLDMELSRLANSGKEISFVQTVLDAVAVSFGFGFSSNECETSESPLIGEIDLDDSDLWPVEPVRPPIKNPSSETGEPDELMGW